MRRYFENRYSPSNMVLAAAGRVDFEELVAAAQRHCGDWQRQKVDRQSPAPPKHEGFEAIEKENSTQQYVIQLTNAPGAEDPRRYAANLLVSILGDSSGSRLYWDLLHTGLAEQVSTHYHDYDGAGMFVTWLCCEPAMTVENIKRIAAIYRKAEREGFTDDELVRAKTKFNSRMVLASERPQNRMAAVGLNWLRRREYRTVKQEMEAFNAVTAEDLSSLIREYPLSKSTTVAVGPLAEFSNLI